MIKNQTCYQMINLHQTKMIGKYKIVRFGQFLTIQMVEVPSLSLSDNIFLSRTQEFFSVISKIMTLIISSRKGSL